MPVTQKEVLLTPEGFRKLEEEIEHLSTTRRDEVAERIKQAREFGDISENSEYDDAKYEQWLGEVPFPAGTVRSAIVYVGAGTSTTSPWFWPSSGCPSGDSLERRW